MILVALGSNQSGPWGDPRQTRERRRWPGSIAAASGSKRASRLLVSAPFGVTDQPAFVNAVAEVETVAPARGPAAAPAPDRAHGGPPAQRCAGGRARSISISSTITGWCGAARPAGAAASRHRGADLRARPHRRDRAALAPPGDPPHRRRHAAAAGPLRRGRPALSPVNAGAHMLAQVSGFVRFVVHAFLRRAGLVLAVLLSLACRRRQARGVLARLVPGLRRHGRRQRRRCRPRSERRARCPRICAAA